MRRFPFSRGAAWQQLSGRDARSAQPALQGGRIGDVVAFQQRQRFAAPGRPRQPVAGARAGPAQPAGQRADAGRLRPICARRLAIRSASGKASGPPISTRPDGASEPAMRATTSARSRTATAARAPARPDAAAAGLAGAPGPGTAGCWRRRRRTPRWDAARSRSTAPAPSAPADARRRRAWCWRSAWRCARCPGPRSAPPAARPPPRRHRTARWGRRHAACSGRPALSRSTPTALIAASMPARCGSQASAVSALEKSSGRRAAALHGLMARLLQAVDDMAANEPRAAADQDTHDDLTFL